MSTKLTLSALVLALTAGAALAGVPRNGSDQLAALAGVESGAYSDADLVNLIDAKRANDREKVAFILSGSARTAAPLASDAQSAALAGVDAGSFTASEVQILTEARRTGDKETAAYILSGTNRKRAAETTGVTPGKAQLAAAVGVDPANYTLAQLVALQPQGDN